MGNKLPYVGLDEKGIHTLFVGGEPYIALAGETHNSSASSLEYMEEQVWPHLKDLNLNTVLLPVYWEDIEPDENSFNFTLVDGIIKQARRENVKLILLWFGLWKNGESNYAPGWVKRDYRRFFRACYRGGHPSNTISPFCREAINADAKAFSMLMKHLRGLDGEEHTVIMIQVQNEVGFLGAERDYSTIAEEIYNAQVPEIIQENYHCAGSWKESFGEDAPEIFMAYHYAVAIETIASAGKKEYPLPMYVNAWLEQFPERPGIYPSGGPTAKMMPIWRQIAKSIDLYAPDIYLSDFVGVCDEYTKHGNPLFIPEARRDPISASNVLYAFGHYNAICFSPFGIEDFMNEQLWEIDNESVKSILKDLNIDYNAFSCEGTGPYLARSYEILQNIKELLLRYRGTEKLQAFIRKSNHEKGCVLPLTNCDLQLSYLETRSRSTGAAGIVIEESPDTFWVIGCNVQFTTLPKKGSDTFVTIISLEEGRFENSVWKPGRVLNGDELGLCTFGDMADVRKIRICLHKP